MKVVLDASVLVARFVPADAAHDDGVRVVQTCATIEVRAIEPVILPAELAGAIARKTGKEHLASVAILQLNAYPWLSIRFADAVLMEKAVRLAARHALRGADAFYLAFAAEQRCPLVTLDGELISRAPNTITVLRPAEWLARIAR